jgi:hypothetical protein
VAITLLEVILSIGIMVPVMGLLLWFYSSSLESRDVSAERIRDVQLARVIVDRIANEIRQSTGFAPSFGAGIFGTRNQISINTVVIPDKALVERRGIRDSQQPGQFDLRQVDYYIAWDDVNTDENGDPRALGLIRRERRTFNRATGAPLSGGPLSGGEGSGEEGLGAPGDAGSPDGDDRAFGEGGFGEDDLSDPTNPNNPEFDPTGGDDLFDDGLDEELSDEEQEGAKRELYAPELKFIEFFYHDGNRWWDSWQIAEGNALPQMVMITVGYTPELPEDEDIEIIKDILKDEDDIEPLPEDRYMVVVRVPQADTFFGSRVQREVSSFADLEDVR